MPDIKHLLEKSVYRSVSFHNNNVLEYTNNFNRVVSTPPYLTIPIITNKKALWLTFHIS